MGLKVVSNDTFIHKDKYSEVVYRKLSTGGVGDHPTDNQPLPILAIFTRRYETQPFQFCGIVSKSYKFLANGTLVSKIIESITEIGEIISDEKYYLNAMSTLFRCELVLKSKKEVTKVGDVLPVIVIENSYNGSKAASINFGIGIEEKGNIISSSFRFGELKQIHTIHSKTVIRYTIANYVDVFKEGITDLIQQNMNSYLTEEQVLSTLDVIEKLGKRRRNEISKILSEIPQVKNESGKPIHSCWAVFLSIIRYSSREPNLNVRSMLENIAESVLVIPPKMLQTLKPAKQQGQIQS